MFEFTRAGPLEWIRLSRGGTILKQGVGLNVWRFRPGSSLALVPLQCRELKFVKRFRTEVGDITGLSLLVLWRVVDPESAVARFEFRVPCSHLGVRSCERLIQSEVSSHLDRHFIEVSRGKLAVDFIDLARRIQDSIKMSSLVASFGLGIEALWIFRPGPPEGAAWRFELLRSGLTERELLDMR